MPEALNEIRIADDPVPDLSREVGGYEITLHYTPSLERAERAVVQVAQGNVLFESLDVPAAEGLELFRHAAAVSPKLQEALS